MGVGQVSKNGHGLNDACPIVLDCRNRLKRVDLGVFFGLVLQLGESYGVKVEGNVGDLAEDEKASRGLRQKVDEELKAHFGSPHKN